MAGGVWENGRKIIGSVGMGWVLILIGFYRYEERG